MKQKRDLFFILAFNVVIFDETVNGKWPLPQGMCRDTSVLVHICLNPDVSYGPLT